MYYLEKPIDRTVIVNGKEHLFFSGYSYLGMGQSAAFTALIKEGIDRVGLLHPSSRVSNTRISIYEEMEATLSGITRQEDTVLFSSGFLSGRAVASLLNSDSAFTFFLAGTHPAIQMDGNLLEVSNNERMEELNKIKAITIVLDSVNPLTAAITDLHFLQQLNSPQITCIIDDSHGMGILGRNGEGIAGRLPALPNVTYVITYSLSKALHLNGGAVSCSKEFAAKLRLTSYYTAATAMPPFLCYAYLKAQHIYQEQLNKLRYNIQVFEQCFLLQKNRAHPGNALPIFVLPPSLDTGFFAQHSIIISSFAYPNPEGEKINRIVLSAVHTEEDLQLLKTLVKAYL